MSDELRLIPAHAGKTGGIVFAWNFAAAHPRSRGENLRPAVAAPTRRGSSPLTRGKRDPAVQRRRTVRLIPAHAGKTRQTPEEWGDAAAHPRSRGENTKSPSRYHWYQGSSPLTRGKPRVGRRRREGVRLIPAHAGKTLAVQRRPAVGPAHPRSRGENQPAVDPCHHPAGSSPLTRGKLELAHTHSSLRRLIPAHAGKTSRTPRRVTSCAAHPRSRGENRRCLTSRRTAWGSSPLTRGKLAALGVPSRGVRLIPAHAGKTVVYCLSASAVAAHPRSRGENDQYVRMNGR